MKASVPGMMAAAAIILTVAFLVLIGASMSGARVYMAKTKMSQSLNNLRQLHLAIQTMALDNAGTAKPVEWTCQNGAPLPLDRLKNLLIAGQYLTSENLQKLQACREVRSWWFDKTIENGVNFYAVEESDADSTILLATKNWQGPSSRELTGEPYGNRGFIIFRKGGDGSIYRQAQLTNQAILGTGGIHDFTILK